MSLAIFLKNNLKNISPNVGIKLNKIPYSIRPGLGRIYTKRRKEIKDYESFTINEKKEFIFKRVFNITKFAFDQIDFYKEYYLENNFEPSQLKSFDDLLKIPTINKAVLNSFGIEERSFHRPGRYLVNTGGSSGTPFSFYIEPSSMGHEWAHMHKIWEKLNYKSSDLKIVFGGRSDLKEVVEYDVVRNHFAIDIYADYKNVSERLKIVLKKHRIKYLHGYPSSIYDFVVYCKENDIELIKLLSKTLEGAFLGSEFPQPLYRKVIEDTLGIKTISWYGHTERCVLAYEKNEQFVYEPFQTYGFSEAWECKDSGKFNLMSTSYYNFASPLIRYNTNDVISEVNMKGGLLESFQISEGREGEVVIDRNGKKINLTGLIFGRHHRIFDFSKFIQVRQIENGKIEIHYVSEAISEESAEAFFDTKNLQFDIKFIKRSEPHRTGSGKIHLLIR